MTGESGADTGDIELRRGSGPACPRCQGSTEVKRHYLTADEHTTIISCTDCEFELESESNLAAQTRPNSGACCGPTNSMSEPEEMDLSDEAVERMQRDKEFLIENGIVDEEDWVIDEEE